jgi:hypothetical protein
MITREKLRIYENYDGDIDGWVRMARPGEKSIEDRDWPLINEMLQSLRIVQSGLANADFEARVRARVAEISQDEDVRGRLLELGKK